MWSGLFFLGQGAREVGQGPPTSEKAWGKAPTVEPPPLEMDEELVWWLHWEEDAAERMWQGQDDATLGVVREATGPLMWGQLEGLVGRLLGGWAEPAAHGCGGLATGGGGILATPPTLTTRPCPTFPFNAHGWPFAGHGHCCGLATHGCPCGCPMSCWVTPAGEPAKKPEVPKLW